MFNNLCKSLTKTQRAFLSHFWIHDIPLYAVKCCFSAILTILAYGFIEIAFSSGKVSKLSCGSADSRDRLDETRETFFVPIRRFQVHC